MKYTRDAAIRAESELSDRRQRAKDEHEARLLEVQTRAPEIFELYSRLNVMNYGLISIIGSGRSREDIDARIAEAREGIAAARQAMKAGLRSFGFPEDYLEVHYHCPKCQDSGFREGIRCSCLDELLRKYTTEELNKNCSIQLHDFIEFRSDLYPDSDESGTSPRKRMIEICQSCQIYVKRFSPDSESLLFFGQTGLGKTFLSSCIARSLLEKGVNVVFGSFLKLTRQIEDEHFNRREGDTMGIIFESELLILDDVGSEFKSPFSESVLYEMINERINRRKPTIVSTNLSLSDLRSRYDERIVSRLTGCFMSFKFVGNDVRKKLRNEHL